MEFCEDRIASKALIQDQLKKLSQRLPKLAEDRAAFVQEVEKARHETFAFIEAQIAPHLTPGNIEAYIKRNYYQHEAKMARTEAFQKLNGDLNFLLNQFLSSLSKRLDGFAESYVGEFTTSYEEAARLSPGANRTFDFKASFTKHMTRDILTGGAILTSLTTVSSLATSLGWASIASALAVVSFPVLFGSGVAALLALGGFNYVRVGVINWQKELAQQISESLNKQDWIASIQAETNHRWELHLFAFEGGHSVYRKIMRVTCWRARLC